MEYDGIEFYRYPESKNLADARYFRSRKAERLHGERYLHRLVYKEHYGSIPKGRHVHHVDGDFANNDPDNLVCLTPAEHLQLHPEDWDGRAAHMQKIQEMAKEWHASEEGREWHSKHWNRSLSKAFVENEYVCDQCGESYKSKSITGSRFCSPKCKAAWRRDSGLDDETRVCEFCGKEFSVNKYKKKRHCSRSCAMKNRSGLGREIVTG